MSAYVVTDNHINTLITWAVAHQVWYRADYCEGREQSLAALLYATNVESVNKRYKGAEETLDFTYHPAKLDGITLLDILRACDCLEYQSCELDTWEDCEALKLLNAIRSAAIRALPGYESAKRDL